MAKPIIVVLEGLDFAGKSTQIHLLLEALRGVGRDPVLVRDPGGTKFGEQMRSIVKNGDYKLSDQAQFFAFMAARAELAAYVTEMHSEGRDVLLDRWWPSTFAYQGAKGIDGNDIAHLSKTYCSIPERTLMLYLDVSAVVAAERKRVAHQASGAAGREEGIKNDRFENLDDAFRTTLRSRYNILVKDGYLKRVDADGTTEQVQQLIQAEIANHLPFLE